MIQSGGEGKRKVMIWMMLGETAFALVSVSLIFAFLRPDSDRFGQESIDEDASGFATLAQASR